MGAAEMWRFSRGSTATGTPSRTSASWPLLFSFSSWLCGGGWRGSLALVCTEWSDALVGADSYRQALFAVTRPGFRVKVAGPGESVHNIYFTKRRSASHTPPIPRCIERVMDLSHGLVLMRAFFASHERLGEPQFNKSVLLNEITKQLSVPLVQLPSSTPEPKPPAPRPPRMSNSLSR